jgi:hypothetical protein
MNDSNRRSEDLAAEIDALLILWDVSPRHLDTVILEDAIKQILYSIRSLVMVSLRFQRTSPSSSVTELENAEFVKNIMEKEIKRLFDVLPTLVPQVPRREFIIGVVSIFQGITSIIDPEI